MKRRIVFLILILPVVLLSFAAGVAQETTDQIESVHISFWPDFDQPSVLVLITGQLPDGASLPAEVSIPIPDNAKINAIARVDDEIGMASIDFETGDGVVTFTPMNPRFRVEYYAPYNQTGSTRSFDFNWVSTHPVGQLSADIQQPASASSLTSDPEALDVSTNPNDGLVYHNFEPQSLPAGTPYRLSFSYEVVRDGLTIDPVDSTSDTVNQVPSSTADETNWLFIAGGLGIVALVIGGTWLVATRTINRKSKRPRKPSPKSRSTVRTVSQYCHVCGQGAESGDRFCRQCGTELKRP